MMLAATHGSENVAYYKNTNQNTVPKLGAKTAEQTCYLFNMFWLDYLFWVGRPAGTSSPDTLWYTDS